MASPISCPRRRRQRGAACPIRTIFPLSAATPGPTDLGNLATPAGFEPATPSLEGWCSIRLSYGVLPSARFTRAADLLKGACWVLRGRSEERRVGKECRSRWSPYH